MYWTSECVIPDVMTTHRLLSGPIALAIFIVATSPLFGQATSGNLVGTVMDASGAGVPGASVEARNRVTNVRTSGIANSNGEYRLSNLLVGDYDVTASAQGFTATTVANIVLHLNATETVNVTLQIGQITQAVEVHESIAVIDTTTAQV